jgi:hypothetical protein
MRTFFSTHWKSIVALILLILLAVLTMTPGAANRGLSARLRDHVRAIAASEHDTSRPAEPERAARHIEAALAAEGYELRRQQYQAGGQQVRNIEVSIANLAGGARPERIFIVGAHYDSAQGAAGADDNGSGTAAVLELARLLKDLQPGRGTEVKFVFFVNEAAPWSKDQEMGSGQHAREPRRQGQNADGAPILAPAGWHSQHQASQRLAPGLAAQYPDTGNFIAFAGTRESSQPVRQALAAFRAGSDFPAEGLAAPSYVEGVTLSDHSSYKRYGYPALMITDTAFMRYPYYHTVQDTGDKLDYDSIARVVDGLARTIAALAGGSRT